MLEEGNEDAQVATHTASSVENSTGGVGTTSGTTAFSLPGEVEAWSPETAASAKAS